VNRRGYVTRADSRRPDPKTGDVLCRFYPSGRCFFIHLDDARELRRTLDRRHELLTRALARLDALNDSEEMTPADARLWLAIRAELAPYPAPPSDPSFPLHPASCLCAACNPRD
jgi:hypothetical protein